MKLFLGAYLPMICCGGENAKRVRRYRAAVYCQCGSSREVDAAFDALTEMMLSDNREEYLWGVLLDYAPSSLFRTFGDYEIEERARYRYELICRAYGECGFFCLLRGRRYCGNGGFRCEGGLYGAIRTLVGGKGDGCALRLCTGDGVECSERLFIWDARGGGSLPLLPCDLTRSSLIGGSVAVCGGRSEGSAKKRFVRCFKSDYSGNYRAVGWLVFPFNPADGVSSYRVYTPEKRGKETVSCWGGNAEKAFEYAKRDFLPESDGGVPYAPANVTDCDGVASSLFAYVALGERGAIDAVNLRKILFFMADRIASDLRSELCGSAGFLRLALLSVSAFCDGMGQHGEEFYLLAEKFKEHAERLRREFETGVRETTAPFLPCEMAAFRISGERHARYFGGFTAIKRLADCFCYLFSGRREGLCDMLKELFLRGFGERGVMSESGRDPLRNALLLCISAELCGGVFTRLCARVPELRSCAPLFYVLPENGWKEVL